MPRRLAALAAAAALAACAGGRAGQQYTVTPKVQVKEGEVEKPRPPVGFQEPPTDEPDPAPPPEPPRAQ